MRRHTAFIAIALTMTALLGTTIVSIACARAPRWTQQQREMLRSLSLSSLEPLRADRSNKYGDDPRAAEVGRARPLEEPARRPGGALRCGRLN